jgi:hypothetical protein
MSMTRHDERGMATSEYAVGTIGACTIALLLHQLAADGTWFEHLIAIIEQALAWRNLADGFPVPNLRIR